MDGPDIIMNAEEYLQPGVNQNGGATITTNSAGSTNGTISRYPDASWPDSPQNFHHRMQARHRYGGSSGGRGPSTIDSRYCSDPLNMLGKDSSDGCYSEGSAKSRQAQVGPGLNLDLPVDDDDYLMPSPHNNQNATTYLDVVGDAKVPGTHNIITYRQNDT
jgi:L1 cell adhesion molecule